MSIVSNVFTPRRTEPNKEMYIDRPLHETLLERAINGTLHTVICGESGSGKSWLYKKLADDKNWHIFTANLAIAANGSSVTDEICNAMIPEDSREWTGIKEGKKANFGVGDLNATRAYSVKPMEKIQLAFKEGRKSTKKPTAVLILENLEAIFHNNDLMDELGNIILLLDDNRYAAHKIKILIVGVPSGLIHYFSKVKNMESIGNRLKEIPHLKTLNQKQVFEFVRRGFIEKLDIQALQNHLDELTNHVMHVTLGIPQRLHEYCEKVGLLIEERDWVVGNYTELIAKADTEYLYDSIYQSYSVVEGSMSQRVAKVNRKDQVLYSLGRVNATSFNSSDVEKQLRSDFSNSTKGKKLGVGSILTTLSSEENPLLRKSDKGGTYRFADPKYLMCLRLILKKTRGTDEVKKLPLLR